MKSLIINIINLIAIMLLPLRIIATVFWIVEPIDIGVISDYSYLLGSMTFLITLVRAFVGELTFLILIMFILYALMGCVSIILSLFGIFFKKIRKISSVLVFSVMLFDCISAFFIDGANEFSNVLCVSISFVFLSIAVLNLFVSFSKCFILKPATE